MPPSKPIGPPRPLELGHRISEKYILGNAIGKGGFGTVYECQNQETGEMVAVKRIALRNLTPDQIRALEQEVDLLKMLHHDNIVKYIATVKTRNHLHIVLQYMENGSLAQNIKKFGVFQSPLVCFYTRQVLLGLQYLHEQGVIHRDIKGANILSDKWGKVKVADFGVAIMAPGRGNSTFNGEVVVGTPYWMAPEIIEMVGPPHTACDVWSVGCTVIELLTSKPPYFDVPQMAALFRIVTDESVPLPENVPEDVLDFLRLCFVKQPGMRPSATDLLEHPWIKSSPNPGAAAMATAAAVSAGSIPDAPLSEGANRVAATGFSGTQANAAAPNNNSNNIANRPKKASNASTPSRTSVSSASQPPSSMRHRHSLPGQVYDTISTEQADGGDTPQNSTGRAESQRTMPPATTATSAGIVVPVSLSNNTMDRGSWRNSIVPMTAVGELEPEDWDRELLGRTEGTGHRHAPAGNAWTGPAQRVQKDEMTRPRSMRGIQEMATRRAVQGAPQSPLAAGQVLEPPLSPSGKSVQLQMMESDSVEEAFEGDRPLGSGTRAGGGSGAARKKKGMRLAKFRESANDADFGDIYPSEARRPSLLAQGSLTLLPQPPGSPQLDARDAGSSSAAATLLDKKSSNNSGFQNADDDLGDNELGRSERARRGLEVQELVAQLKVPAADGNGGGSVLPQPPGGGGGGTRHSGASTNSSGTNATASTSNNNNNNNSSSASNAKVMQAAKKLVEMFRETPALKRTLRSHDGVMPLLDTLSRGSDIEARAVLEVLNEVAENDRSFQELLIMAGIVPLVTKYCGKDTPLDTRRLAAELVRHFLCTSPVALHMFVACNGLDAIVSLLGSKGNSSPVIELAIVAVDGVQRIFAETVAPPGSHRRASMARAAAAAEARGNGVGGVPKNVFCMLFAKTPLLERLASLGHRLQTDEGKIEMAKLEVAPVGLLAEVCHIFAIFSQSSTPAKVHLASCAKAVRCMLMTCASRWAAAAGASEEGLEDDVDDDVDTVRTVLHAFKNLSTESACLDHLDVAGLIPAIVPFLSVRQGPPESTDPALARKLKRRRQIPAVATAINEVHNLAMIILFYMLRMNPSRQEKAASVGIIAYCKSAVVDRTPVKTFAMQILIDLAHGSHATRIALYREGAVDFFLETLRMRDPFWQERALQAIEQFFEGTSSASHAPSGSGAGEGGSPQIPQHHQQQQLQQQQQQLQHLATGSVSVSATRNPIFGEIERSLLRPFAILCFVELFQSAQSEYFESVLKTLFSMLSASKRLAEAIGRSGLFVSEITARLSYPKAEVRISLLRLLSLVADNHTDIESLLLDHNLPSVVSAVNRQAKAQKLVIVAAYSDQLLTTWKNILNTAV